MRSLLTVAQPLNERETEWIVEDELGRFEVEAVFPLVGLVLRLIPLKSKQLYVHYDTYRQQESSHLVPQPTKAGRFL